MDCRLVYQPSWYLESQKTVAQMPKKQQGWITFQSSPEERTILEAYCEQSKRSKTEVLRELIRSLNQQWQQLSGMRSPQVNPTIPQPIPYQTIGISARNNLRGTIKQVLLGDVNAEVLIEIVPGVEIVAVITRSSVERFELVPGKPVCAVIKSSDVMVAVESELA